MLVLLLFILIFHFVKQVKQNCKFTYGSFSNRVYKIMILSSVIKLLFFSMKCFFFLKFDVISKRSLNKNFHPLLPGEHSHKLLLISQFLCLIYFNFLNLQVSTTFSVCSSQFLTFSFFFFLDYSVSFYSVN